MFPKNLPMNKYRQIAGFSLRIALAFGFLSAVASRLSLWGSYSSGWDNFVSYTGKVNSFLSPDLVLPLAIISTILESSLGLLLLMGFKTSLAAAGSGLLTLLFAIAMSYSFGIKDPLDYSVFVFSSAAFLLASMTYYPWSIDELITQKKRRTK